MNLSKKWTQITILIIVILAIMIRIKAQGNPRLSIANNDTASYITSSEVSLFSWDAFTGRRLFITNVIYQLMKPDGGYEILVNGSENTTKRRIQPTFVNIALLQFVISLFSWSALALSISGHLKNSIPKILATILILAFAFVPQMADWDSILASESLSLSLFALQTALLIDLAFRSAQDAGPDFNAILLTGAWLVTVFFWAFLKDAHLYTILVLVIMIAGTLTSRKFRKQILPWLAISTLTVFFLLGWTTSEKSVRTQVQLVNVYRSDILSDPARIEFMRANGMPEPGSLEYEPWFAASAKKSYLRFLLFHPAYLIINYFEDIPYAFSENAQPYFNTQPQLVLRKALIPVGNILHPENSLPMYLAFLFVLGILTIAHKKSGLENKIWGWLAVYIFLSAGINMFVNIFGDVFALPRHALVATTTFRLFMWVFIIIFVDLMIPSRKNMVYEMDNSK